jgi:hypothetical protein
VKKGIIFLILVVLGFFMIDFLSYELTPNLSTCYHGIYPKTISTLGISLYAPEAYGIILIGVIGLLLFFVRIWSSVFKTKPNLTLFLCYLSIILLIFVFFIGFGCISSD